MKTMIIALLATTTMGIASPTIAAPTLFDGGTPTGVTVRGAGSGPGQSFAVTTATTLTNIGFYSASPSGGNIKYLIFDATGTNLLFSITSAATNLSDTVSLIQSPTFSFNLAAGSSYQFGIISDNLLDVGFDFPQSFASQNGLTSFGNNLNYTSYTSPALSGGGLASIPVTLYGVQDAMQAAVPEPATWAMMFLGMGAVGFAMRRRQKVTTRVSYAV